MCDQYWVNYDNTQNTLLVGGRADHGGSGAGLASILFTTGSSDVSVAISFRCLTLIS